MEIETHARLSLICMFLLVCFVLAGESNVQILGTITTDEQQTDDQH